MKVIYLNLAKPKFQLARLPTTTDATLRLGMVPNQTRSGTILN